jgi:hypothetical protein
MGDVNAFLEFCELVDRLNDSDRWSLVLAHLSYEADCVTLKVRVETCLDEVPNQDWEIRAHKVREVKLQAGRTHGAELYADHVLLWGYKEPITRLFFKGPPERHEEVLWRLYERNFSLTQGLIPFDRYVNSHFIRNRLSGGFGLLAEGPDRLLREYASVLETTDLEPYFPYNSGLPRRWSEDLRRWVSDDKGLSVLILGESHIIGTSFSADRA